MVKSKGLFLGLIFIVGNVVCNSLPTESRSAVPDRGFRTVPSKRLEGRARNRQLLHAVNVWKSRFPLITFFMGVGATVGTGILASELHQRTLGRESQKRMEDKITSIEDQMVRTGTDIADIKRDVLVMRVTHQATLVHPFVPQILVITPTAQPLQESETVSRPS